MADGPTSADLPRVLVLSDLYPTLGSPQGGSFVLDRIDALVGRGVEVEAVALRPSPSALLKRALKAAGRSLGQSTQSVFQDAVYPMGMLDYVQTSRRLPRARLVNRIADEVMAVAGEQGFDVIHAHGMYRAKAGAIAQELSRRSGVPFVVTLHGSDVNTHMRRNPKPFAAVLRDAASVIYVSEALRDTAVALGAPTDNAQVIPNGVDTDLFRPGRKDPTAPVISFVGGLAPVKGADRLPDIFRGVSSRVPSARFEVVGVGGLRSQIEEQTRDLDVVFHGHVDRAAVAEVMARTSVLVVPSRSEGWGCVVLEAQAAGAVAVATRVGGLVESVGDDRFLASEALGAEGLVDRVVDALTERGEVLRRRALGFRWEVFADKEIGTYRTALRRQLVTSAPLDQSGRDSRHD